VLTSGLFPTRIVILIVGICLALSGYFLFKLVRDEININLLQASSVIYLAFLSKEFFVSPKKVPARVFFFNVGLTGAIIFWSYNAGLVSFLSVDIFTYKIRSLEVCRLEIHIGCEINKVKVLLA
jgi:hypothetical protein